MRIDENTSVYLNNVEIYKIKMNNVVIWEKSVDETDYFYIQNTYNGQNTVTLTTSQNGTPTSGIYATSVQYSKDKRSWSSFTLTAGGTNTISLNQGEKVYFRNDSGYWNYYLSSSTYFETKITANQTHTVGGNVNTLLDYTNLNSVSLSTGCFNDLFYRDTTLTSASSLSLPSTTLASGCYKQMFFGCSNLTSTPTLPATTLKSQCYSNMFNGCTSLTTPPTLPAATLSSSCYAAMFRNCTSLTTTPVLPATTLVNACYQYMFGGCVLVDSITTYADDISATNCIQNWLNGVAATGTFNNNGAATYTVDSPSGIPVGWTEVKPIDYFYVQNAYNGTNMVTLTTRQSSTPTSVTYATSVEYSKDRDSWSTLTLTAGGTNTISLNQGEKVYFRNNSGYWNSLYIYTIFTASQTHTVGGNVNTLLDYTNLNSVSLSTRCFNDLFREDSNLTSASSLSLPATTLTQGCYSYMFYGCTSLTSSPVLPATTLASQCYNGMFSGCTALTSSPALPATTVEYQCYSGMFRNCTALTSSPVLPATTLAGGCYQEMFRGCSRLNTITTYADDISATNCLLYWVLNVSNTGTFNNMGMATYNKNSSSGIPNGWTNAYNYFYIQNTYNGTNTVTLTTTQNGTPTAGTYATSVEYSKDKRNWSSFTLTAGGTNTVSLSKNERVYFRNNSGKWNYYYNISNNFYTTFTASQTHNVVGNANTLIDHEDPYNATLSVGCFAYLFNGDTNLILSTGLELPSMTLASSCYRYMFMGCSSMDGSTSLPATTLASLCYDNMYTNCTSLYIVTTSLPATTLVSGCYSYMFYGCSRLMTVPNLPATTLTTNCYHSMFRGCSLLTTAPNMAATTLGTSSCRNMFYECINLTAPPTLLATTLTDNCYREMFFNCKKLNTLTTYANDISATDCITNWLVGVEGSGTFNNMGSAVYPTNSASGIPTGWTEV